MANKKNAQIEQTNITNKSNIRKEEKKEMQAEKYGKKAKEIALKEYDKEIYYNKIIEIYKKALEGV